MIWLLPLAGAGLVVAAVATRLGRSAERSAAHRRRDHELLLVQDVLQARARLEALAALERRSLEQLRRDQKRRQQVVIAEQEAAAIRHLRATLDALAGAAAELETERCRLRALELVASAEERPALVREREAVGHAGAEIAVAREATERRLSAAELRRAALSFDEPEDAW